MRINLVALAILGILLIAAQSAAGAQRVIIGTQLEPPVLDPTANPAAAISEVLYGNVYEGLVQFAPDGGVLPKLAASWEVSDDGLSYVFHLLKDVRFHDGAVFDASAAKFSLQRILASDSVNPQRSRLRAIQSVEAIDPATLRLRLSRRSGGLLQALAFGSAVMVSPQSAAGNALNPVGTGPFRFLRWRRGDSLTLERNPDYRKTPAALGQVTFKFITDPTAAFAALMAGDVDAFSNYPAPESFGQFAADRRFKVFTGTTEMETVLGFNERRAPLNNLLVRRAISFALDRRAIIDGAMYGYGTPIGSHFPPGNPAYIDLTGRYPHDVAKAQALLTQAGYGAGLTLSLKLPPPSYARRSGEIIAAQLAQVGIRVRIENLEWAQWLDQVYTRHEFDLSIVGHAEPLDYDIYARDDYYFGYSSPDFKALIAALEESVDPATRTALLQQIQRKLADDAVNGFLFQYPRLDIWNVHLHEVGFNNVLGIVDLSQAYLDADAHLNHSQESDAARAGLAPVLQWTAWVFGAALVMLLVLVLRRLGSAYVTGRVAVLAATLLAASVVIFTIVQIVPGDPVRYMMGLQADPDSVAALRSQLGLDAAPWHRYLSWVGGLLRGDFGLSYTYRVPVRALLAERLQVSLPLAIFALAIAVALAFPTALYAAARRGRAPDAVIGGVTQLFLAIPNFWLGIVLVLFFAIALRWVSAGGFPGWDAGFLTAVKALALPAIALAMPQAAILARVLRGALIESLQEDYIRTARAKGVGELRVLMRHALPNALVPVLTILGLQFSFLLAGGVIIENVFFLPGLGRLIFQAISQRDLMVVQSVVVMLVFAVVTVTFLVDLGYVLINPQLQAARSA